MDRKKLFTCWSDEYTSLDQYYMSKLEPFSPNMDGTDTQLNLVTLQDMVSKAELTTADTGAWNHIYQYGVFTQYATRANTFGVLPKRPWEIDGYRAVTAASKSSGVGIAEAQSLGTAVEPTYAEVAPDPKEWELVSDFSNRLQFYSKAGDAISVDKNRQVIEKDFFRSLNADLVKDNDTLAGNNAESIDRICGSYAEITACGQTAGDLDIYGFDRDAAPSWADAYVNQNGTTDRDFSTTLLNSLRENCEPYWDDGLENKVFVTGYDTFTRLSEIESAKQRLGTETVTVTVGDGIKTSPGATGGLKIATWDGIPMIRDDLIQKDTISRVYLLDTANLGIAMGMPIEYNEVDGKSGQGAAIVGHRTRGWWYGIGELYCTKFKSQGKLRELQ